MDSQNIKLSQVSIFMLGVRDIGASVAFYRDQLGIEVKGQMGGFAFLDAGAVTLCLSLELAKAGGQIVGATEVVFAVEHVRVAYEALRARGVTFTIEPRVVTGASWAANFNDLDGHKLSIFGPE